MLLKKFKKIYGSIEPLIKGIFVVGFEDWSVGVWRFEFGLEIGPPGGDLATGETSPYATWPSLS